MLRVEVVQHAFILVLVLVLSLAPRIGICSASASVATETLNELLSLFAVVDLNIAVLNEQECFTDDEVFASRSHDVFEHGSLIDHAVEVVEDVVSELRRRALRLLQCELAQRQFSVKIDGATHDWVTIGRQTIEA